MVMVLALQFSCTDDVHTYVNHVDESAKEVNSVIRKIRRAISDEQKQN